MSSTPFPAAASLTSSAAARKSRWWVLGPAHEAGVPFRARSISSRCGAGQAGEQPGILPAHAGERLEDRGVRPCSLDRGRGSVAGQESPLRRPGRDGG
ncbi:MAG TPA: hypothetical protein VGD83_03690 [Streptosporangiaceae bacterium]